MADNMVFIALQATEEARPIIQAIRADNPQATVTEFPGMVKIDAPGRLVIRRETIESEIGRAWDPMEIHVNVISISGNIDETDDYFALERT